MLSQAVWSDDVCVTCRNARLLCYDGRTVSYILSLDTLVASSRPRQVVSYCIPSSLFSHRRQTVSYSLSLDTLVAGSRPGQVVFWIASFSILSKIHCQLATDLVILLLLLLLLIIKFKKKIIWCPHINLLSLSNQSSLGYLNCIYSPLQSGEK